MTKLELYKQWNDAFYEHFFGGERDNVILYVDNEIINEIGHRLDPEDEDPINTFFTTVLMSPDERFVFAREIYRNNCGFTLVQDDIRDNNIFYLAKELAEKGNNPRNNYLRLPCLNYLVFIIYTFQYGQEDERAEHPQWRWVSDVINDYLGENITNDRAATVEQLFKAVSDSQPNFDSNLTAGVQPYVGRIKYQFVLNNVERRQLYDIMVSHHLRWDEDRISYAEFANRNILPFLTGNRYEGLRKKILESNNNIFFRNIISQFDSHTHQTGEIEDNRIHGTLLYIYSLEKKCFMIGLDMNLEGDLQIEDMYFAPEREFYGLYLADCERIQQITPRHIETEDKHICTIDDDVKYFELKGLYYIQCTADDPINGRPYLVVSNNERKLRAAVNGQDGRDLCIQEFGFNYQYFVQSWTVQERRNAQRIVKERPFSFGFGIKNPSKPNCYYPEGVPSIVVSNELIGSIQSIKVVCKQVGHQDRCCEIDHFKKYEGKELFYRLPNVLLEIKDPYKLEVYIVNNSDVEEFVGVINIQPCHLEDYARSSFIYDKWNRTLPEVPENSPYYQNNKVYQAGSNNHQIGSVFLRNVSDQPSSEDMMMLANILFVVFNQEKEINDSKLNNIIKYVGGYFNFDAGDYKIKNSLKHSLLNLGFMSRSYSSEYTYRANNARIIKTNRNVNLRCQNVCLLNGTYSYHEIDKIIEAGCTIKYRWPFEKTEVDNRPYLKCLPDLILVDNYEPDRMGLKYIDHPLADDVIDFIGNMQEFEQVFLNKEGYQEEGDTDKNQLPYFKKVDGRVILKTVRGTYYNYEFTNAFGNRQFYRLPEELVKLYCQNKHHKPVCIVKDRHKGNEFPSIYFERYTMGVPRLLQKALCELNLSLPSLILVFPVDQFISGGRLYSQLYEYKAKDLKCVIAEKLSGHSIEDVYNDLSVAVVKHKKTDNFMKCFDMKLISFQKEGDNIEESLVLYFNYLGRIKLMGFSYGQKVYGTKQTYMEEITDYFEIVDATANAAFSAMMMRPSEIQFGNHFDGPIPSVEIPNFKSERSVEIMFKSNNN